jgi:hypothetical protein
MEEIKNSDSLLEFQRKESRNRRILIQAQTILKRAEKSGIPQKYMRIKPDVFKSLLDTQYHKNVDKVTDFIYKTPLELLKKEFIVIDGGNIVQRKRAGFAILFRLIACDKHGLCKNGGELAHQLQSLRVFEEGMGRNDLSEELRQHDVLFISECSKDDFRKGFETGRFFDEILTYRDDNVKPTIVSFVNPLPSKENTLNSKNEMNETDQFGQYMCSLSKADKINDDRIFRIRVGVE